jgi:hypothetical protein
MFCNEHGIVRICDPRAFVIDNNGLVVPIAHKHRNYLIPLLKQQMCSNCRVYSARQANHYPFHFAKLGERLELASINKKKELHLAIAA